MKSNKEQIAEILRVFRITISKDFSNIEAISIGSDYKTKEQILISATSQARNSRRYVYLITSCLEYLNEGYSFAEFIDLKLDDIRRSNQCEQDKADSIEELNRLSEEVIDI